MSDRVLRIAGYVLAVLGGLGLVISGLLGQERVADAALGVGVVGLAVAAFLSFRRQLAATQQLQRRIAMFETQLAAGGREGARSRQGRGNGQSPATARDIKALSGQLRGVVGAIDQVPSQVVELQRRYDQLVTSDQPMPGFGSWAATAPTVLAILDEVLSNPERRQVLECGSGSSTVWLAAAFAHRGEGHVTALEHDLRFAEETRGRLAAHGLSTWATVLDAPLVDTEVETRHSQPWYELAGQELPEKVDLLFVDGPPGNTADLARYPAWPLLMDRLRAGSWVVLDDTHRADERKIRDLWQAQPIEGTTLDVVKVVGRTTFLQVTPS